MESLWPGACELYLLALMGKIMVTLVTVVMTSKVDGMGKEQGEKVSEFLQLEAILPHTASPAPRLTSELIWLSGPRGLDQA